MLKQTLAVLAGALALSATAADLTIKRSRRFVSRAGVSGLDLRIQQCQQWNIRVNYQPLGSGARNQSDQGGNREFRRNRQAAQN